MQHEWLQVYFIMGSNNTVQDPLEVLEEALKGGITCFQFREKGKNALQGTAKKQLAEQMKQLCQQYRVPFFINDDVDLAIEIGADGVHVGQDDMSIAKVREIVPADCVIGVSASNIEEAVQAHKEGADYIGVGPIFGTNTKEDAKQPIGIEGLSHIREKVGTLPIVAIGGIKLRHVIPLRKAGGDGVSIITAISQAESPQLMAKTFWQYNRYFS
ncbi:thiamine phosphate synthase [Gracilibacillus caseinilyticus]|uniref:Thiamine-phosphate synthase n=1 Tax=Gracilibacillus caseinilyticus TaxID=2932256 RepID=A0ABY4F3Y5_9BACI|nr:thiamine phosphate synthase [Gracilibacillus caseinilyticus]UOQ49181.1 thiamine phosphate synthase [Gracilibacillus caseinilyticus]